DRRERDALVATPSVHLDGSERCIHELFEAHARRAPEQIAVICETEQRTYRELDRDATRLAHRLVALGVGPGLVVGLHLARSIEFVVAMLAVLKAGGAYLPLDPELPHDRLSYMAADAHAVVVLSNGDLSGPWKTVRVDDKEQDAPALLVRARPDDLVYVLYTSGSTGRPKGVLVEHRGLVNYTLGVIQTLRIAPGTSFATVTTLSGDVGNTAIFPALCGGGTLHLISWDRATSARQLGEYLTRHRIDVLKAVPSLAAALIDSEHPEAVLPRQMLILGGEPLPWDLVDRVAALAPRCVVLNSYGPTETTVAALMNDTHGARYGVNVPVGRPLPNQRAYILDASRHLTPPGVVGEMYIGGAGVSRGYVGRPDLTEERFVPDPFVPGARMYRTGDRVRRLPDGSVEFLGRVDTQVKLRGFRIELGEIEATIRTSAHVADAAVVVREDTPGHRYLAAYVVARHGLDIAKLEAALADALPDYMIPSAFVTLSALPLTVNGKLDRRALPTPTMTSGAEYVAPRTAVEEAIATTWRELLGVERVGIRDDFFALGGHSLLATRLVARLRAQFAIDLPVRAIFEAKTIEGLAARSASGAEAPSFTLLPRGAHPPLSFAQQRLWFLAQLDPGSPAYQVAYARRLEALDLVALQRAIEALVSRHEILRTTFPALDGEPYQQVHPPGPWSLDGPQGHSFDLATGPLFRAHVTRVADDAHVLYVTFHHIVTDGASYRVFWSELWAYYDAFVDGRSIELPPLPVQYADYAAWQRSWLKGPELDRQLAFWTERLRGAPDETALPFKGPRPAHQTFGGRTVELTLDLDLARRVRGLARGEGASLFMTFAAGLRALLGRYTGQADILLGTAITNRNTPELEKLIGMFVNTLVLRNELRDDDSFATLLQREKAHALAAYDHQHTPFELVVDALGVERSLSRPPVFQVMYVHQGALTDVRGTSVGTDAATALFDLSIDTWEAGEQLGLSIVYNTDLFEHGLVEQLARHFVRLLDLVTRDPQQSLDTLDILSVDEHARLHAWNATEHPFDGALVPDLVEAQVDRTPDAIAVELEAAHLTFRELDIRANQLAHALRARGAGPDEPILLLLERSLDLPVAMLAIAKAGAAYLPVNPSTPRDRVQRIATDAHVRIVVGHHALAPLVDGLPVHTIWLDRAPLGDQPVTRPRNEIHPDQLAYVLSTSGSTGTPKGVMITHRALANHMRWMLEELAFGPDDVILQRTPYQFDASGWELWAPLMCGARMVIIGPDLHGDPHHLVTTMREKGVTVAQFVPTLLAAILDEESLADTVLTRVFCGGEALSGALVRRFDAPAACELFNLYGPTEATIDATMARVPRDVADEHVSIGRPVANTTTHVLDAAKRPVPAGVTGELFIGGVQLARGYLHRPDLTAERFVDVSGARLYRTGDRVRWNPDGTLAYRGRADDQIKLRGFRIELGEIEATLRALVADAAVVLREDTPGNPQLVAYVVPSDLDIAQLRSALATTLPDYMVPSAFVALTTLPLTPNGKLDRRALPVPDVAFTAYAAPRD
ncbi:MAG TPA: amino acid adenylation domain-containing protein, partial [Kofleriaceae bacterium]